MKTLDTINFLKKSAVLYQNYFLLGKLRTMKGAVTLYVSADYKLRFSL